MNIIISGWPGAGSTTLSLLLAHLLGYKYLYAGGVWRFIAAKYGVRNEIDFVKFEQEHGESFDYIWDKHYAPWKLSNSDQLVFDSKIAGLFNEGEHVYEIMVLASPEARALRATTDQREQAIKSISMRDHEIRRRWMKKAGVDIFDYDLLQDHYDLVFDTSMMTIESELQTILRNLEEDYRFPSSNLQTEKKKIEAEVKLYWEKGKPYFVEQLQLAGALVSPMGIIKEWQKHFKKEMKASGMQELLKSLELI